ncbi:stress protein, tellurium resistance protein TerZ [Pasteurellaceae bacterium 15-036681]|nr:stress protein, tellurium resistance protein TerZ [Pasteurellaceae bacterium 15-036681]
MKKQKLIILFSLSLLSFSAFTQQYYVAPPTSSTRGYVPVISDELMKQCVEYNQAKWISEELDRTIVNRYSSYEVEQYNNKIAQVNSYSDWFNRNCAGKQSYSACKAAQELNAKQGLETQSCR